MSSTNAHGVHRVAAARDAAARLWAARCKDHGADWDAGESVLQAAGDAPGDADWAVDPLLDICASCPIATECRTWAHLDRYTGVAAGAVMVNGRTQPNWRLRRTTSMAS